MRNVLDFETVNLPQDQDRLPPQANIQDQNGSKRGSLGSVQSLEAGNNWLRKFTLGYWARARGPVI